MGYEDDPNGEVTLESFIGLRTLRAIGQAMITSEGYPHDTVQQIVIDVDGILYEFTEGSNDGLRSSLGSLRSVRTTPHRMAVIDPPLVVHFHHRARGDRDGADCIYAINERTGLVVLDIGTDNIDDYYPSFIFSWDPVGWTPKWLEPRIDGPIVKDNDGKPWMVLDDFASHAEAKALLDKKRSRDSRVRAFCIRLNKKTMRFEVHERQTDGE
jgi:hypothetical protein